MNRLTVFALEDIVNQLDPHFQRVLTEIGFADLAVNEEAAAEQALRLLASDGIKGDCREI